MAEKHYKRGENPNSIAQAKKNTEKYQFGRVDVNPGDNSRYVAHELAVMQMPVIDYTDPAQVEQRIYDYWQMCADHDMKPTVQGYLNALRIKKSTIQEWKQGHRRKDTHQEVILNGYAMLQALWEDYMNNGKINPVSGIFLGKNFFGMSDRQEIAVAPAQVEAVDVKEIEEKYAELPDDDD